MERHHRTIKRTAARARISPMMAVHLYNAAPLVGEKSDSYPAHLLHQYKWTSKLGPVIESSLEPPEGPFHVGQAVMVRPNGARCTSSWNDGTVTGLISEWTIEVDGVPRHVSHVRAKDPGQSSSDSSTDFNEEVKEEPVRRYPVRNRRRPQYLIEESRGDVV